MTTPTPTMEQAYAAVVAELNAMSPLPGTILHYENHLDSDQELIEHYQDSPSTDLLLVSCASAPATEGPAAGENYTVYNFTIRYLSVEVIDPQWSRIAQRGAERVRDQLDGNLNVFAINGQRQLRTEETVALEALEHKPIGDNQVYEARITFSVEARRWS